MRGGISKNKFSLLKDRRNLIYFPNKRANSFTPIKNNVVNYHQTPCVSPFRCTLPRDGTQLHKMHIGKTVSKQYKFSNFMKTPIIREVKVFITFMKL